MVNGWPRGRPHRPDHLLCRWLEQAAIQQGRGCSLVGIARDPEHRGPGHAARFPALRPHPLTHIALQRRLRRPATP
jgi:hypothetical protein